MSLNQAKPNWFYPECQSALSRTLLHYCGGQIFFERAVYINSSLKSAVFSPGLQSTFYPWSAVCILPLVCSLYFTPGLQSAFYPWSVVCILTPVCSLHFNPATPFICKSPDPKVCSLPSVFSLHFTPGRSAVLILPPVCSLQFAFYVPIKSKLQHPPPGQPSRHLNS